MRPTMSTPTLPSTATTPSSQTYPASCHCGRVRYSVTLSPSLSDPERVIASCNCSICTRNGYLLVYAKHEDVIFTQGQDDLSKYSFNSHRITHFFCPTCSSSLYAQSNDATFKPTDIKAVNIRMFEDLDLESLRVKKVDGRSV